LETARELCSLGQHHARQDQRGNALSALSRNRSWGPCWAFMFMVPGGFGHVLRRSPGVIWGVLCLFFERYLEGSHMHTQKCQTNLHVHMVLSILGDMFWLVVGCPARRPVGFNIPASTLVVTLEVSF
jgi:hypothetical protein